jgi:predicted nucleotidyltransferase
MIKYAEASPMAIPHVAVSDDRIADLCRRWTIRELSVFGSVVRQDVRADSDIDVLVSCEAGAGWSLLDLVTMQTELAAVLGRPVDLIEEAALRNPYRRAAILESKQVVCAA